MSDGSPGQNASGGRATRGASFRGASRLPAFTEVAGGAAWQVSSTRRRPWGVLAGPQGLSKPGRKRVRSLKVFKGGSSPKKTLQAQAYARRDKEISPLASLGRDDRPGRRAEISPLAPLGRDDRPAR